MKWIKIYEDYKNIEGICDQLGIKDWNLNSDGRIDVNGTVNMIGMALSKIPLKFGRVEDGFHCSNNRLTSLEGAPSYVGGHFFCNSNRLTSLEGAPSYVGGDYHCDVNKLSSLVGLPNKIKDLHCYQNKIYSFEGIISIERIYCENNPIQSIWRLFQDLYKIELFNEFDPIRGKDIIIDRLNDFLITIGKEPVERVIGYNNI